MRVRQWYQYLEEELKQVTSDERLGLCFNNVPYMIRSFWDRDRRVLMNRMKGFQKQFWDLRKLFEDFKTVGRGQKQGD